MSFNIRAFYLALNVWESEETNNGFVSDIINEADITGNLDTGVSVGETIYDESTDSIYMFLGQSLPIEGREIVLQEGIEQSLRKGSFVYDPAKEKFSWLKKISKTQMKLTLKTSILIWSK